MYSTREYPIRRHRLTVEEYYRMGEVGILPADARVELVDGEIIDLPPIGSRHAGTIDQLTHLLTKTVGDEAIVRVQSPIRLDEYSEPEPDVTLLRPSADFYKSSHPFAGDVLLLIEVAERTLRYDLEVKVPLYARHGIPEVWVVDLEHGRLARYRDPREGEYTEVDQPDLRTPLEVPSPQGHRVDVEGLLGSLAR
jgi:Uma2 family endonuclease